MAPRLRLLFAALLGSLALMAVPAGADSVGRLQMNGTFRANFKTITCPAGTPRTTNCYSEVSALPGVIPGLGTVTTAYTLFFDDFDSSCSRLRAQIPIIVAGKGEIDLATRSVDCITPNRHTTFPPVEVTVSGGSGRYAGASGSGLLAYANHDSGGNGNQFLTWTGTLSVAGLAFDTTPPRIAGATSKLVKTRSVAGARVRYAVNATDATDGPVQAACLPKSGSLFRGRTSVSCTAVDGSSNVATARFVITVRRVR